MFNTSEEKDIYLLELDDVLKKYFINTGKSKKIDITNSLLSTTSRDFPFYNNNKIWNSIKEGQESGQELEDLFVSKFKNYRENI